MSSDHFDQLPQLEDLQIKYCKLRTVPAAAFAGLTSLKRLALQSHNAVIMEMHQDTFQVSSLNPINNNIIWLWSIKGHTISEALLLFSYFLPKTNKNYFLFLGQRG